MKEPAQPQPGRWQTLPAEVTVAAVVHTPVSMMRMLDYAALLEPDPRVRLEWTIAPDRFNTGTEQLLEKQRVSVVPWAQALERPYDLALTTSLHQVEFLQAKRKFAAPHGCGYGKRYPSWAWPAHENPPVYGLDRESLLDRDGRPVFDSVLLPHLADLAVLIQQCPEVAHTAIVGGDLAFDRLMAAGAYRERYRLDFGVRRKQTLVALGSTWGGESLLAKFRDLPNRLLTELSADHKMIMTMHPAAWYEHGPRQIRAWMRDANEAGLDFIGPGVDWRPLLAAADVFIGDHTSLTSYAAAAGVPVLLSHYSPDEIAPTSLIAELAEVCPRLTDEPLPDQLAMARQTRDAQQNVALARISAHPGRSALVVRKALYRLIGLPEPDLPPRVDPMARTELDLPDY
ncbi:hypothetical protein [Actinocrispum wychmicini]|uniref:CDP-glycerol:poly(Glycerophosphate) glycerophosphotransferase n=1 Tax=Actinocrispum wychmicini TaxID=1213861 RepID=A0A4R2JQH0_9PSEU|nr:hypothetical protein [Actinocrispum wychmicini]TCO62473.1 hypothetical protein EV192_102611 [Actinocrispum wychmicini]